ncbi:MAG: hypothetical protein DRI84_08855 [Bacteroidetes bacterium]|nr:MAG: hypothetical protein DRI84_08855 [Bacteroidota bacterium]
MEFGASTVKFIKKQSTFPRAYNVSTSVCAIEGVGIKGNINEPQRTVSMPDWEKIFGGATTIGNLWKSADIFYKLGGVILYTNRVTHYTTIGTPASLTAVKASGTVDTSSGAAVGGAVVGTNTAPFAFVPGDTLLISVDGAADDTATFDATSAAHTCANAETYNITGNVNLTVKIDGGTVQDITLLVANLTSGAATAQEVVNEINRLKIIGAVATLDATTTKVVITSDVFGTDSGVQVTGGTANATLGFTTGLISGTGDVADILGVTLAELTSVIEADIAGVDCTDNGSVLTITTVATGSAHDIQVNATSTTETIIGLDTLLHAGADAGTSATLNSEGLYYGTYGNNVTIVISDASNADVALFNMVVNYNGYFEEEYLNASISASSSEYILTKVNGESAFIALTDPSVSTRPTNGTYTLASGNDGLTSLVDADYIGNVTAQNGLYAFDTVGIDLLAIPGITTTAVQNGLKDYCHTYRADEVHFFIEAPEGSSAAEAVTHINTTTSLKGSSDAGAMFTPWCKITNPDSGVFTGELINNPPSPFVLGKCSYNESILENSQFQPPAGVLYGALPIVKELDNEDMLDIRKRDTVFPENINPITFDASGQCYIDGEKNLNYGSTSYGEIGQKRGLNFIKASIINAVDPVRHLLPLGDKRKSEAVRNIYNFMETITDFLVANDAGDMYTIDAGDGVNTAVSEKAGKLYIDVGFEIAGTYKWIIVRVPA